MIRYPHLDPRASGTRRTLFGALVLLAAGIVLGGCPSATPKATQEPEEAAVPSLLGTWRSTGGYYKQDEHVGNITYTLTFTKSRWIEHSLAVLDDGTVDDQWANSGTWEVEGSTVTRKWNDNDDDQDQHVERSVDKDYVWVSEDVVLIHHWFAEDSQTYFSRYNRVEDPIPGSITGVWKFESTVDRDEGQSTSTWTFTIGDSFTEHYNETGATNETWILTGSSRHDTEEHIVYFTVESVTEDGATSEELRVRFVGHELRAAYAPTGIKNQVAFSYYWDELYYDETTNTWEIIEERRYGNYERMFFERDTE